MEAGFRQGQPRTGGTPGTTGTEEITSFNLSTETESDLSLIWIKKFLRMLENMIRSSVEKRQRRFRGIISNKHELSIHQSSRKRLRLMLRDHVMSGGPEKPWTACSTLRRKPSGGSSGCSRNSPGRNKLEP